MKEAEDEEDQKEVGVSDEDGGTQQVGAAFKRRKEPFLNKYGGPENVKNICCGTAVDGGH